MDTMKKFMYVLVVLLGIGAVVYLLTHKKSEQSWDEVLNQVPTL